MRRVDDARSALMHHAKSRATVTWKDGRGILLHVGPRSEFAKVAVAGRHLRIPVTELRVEPPEQAFCAVELDEPGTTPIAPAPASSCLRGTDMNDSTAAVKAVG